MDNVTLDLLVLNKNFRNIDLHEVPDIAKKFVSGFSRTCKAKKVLCNLAWERFGVSPSDRNYANSFIMFELYRAVFDEFAKQGIETTFLVNSFHTKEEHYDIYDVNTKVIPINWHLWYTYSEVFLNDTAIPNDKWNRDADKYLFLTGKPNRTNRIRLLWKMYAKGLLDKCVWSFFMAERHHLFNNRNKQYRETRRLLPELTDTQFNDFIFDMVRYPDAAAEMVRGCTAGDWLSLMGNKFSTELYSNTKFRVISEGSDIEDTNVFITEKTYQAILNRVPFMITGQTNYEKKLQEMGFKTYEQYMRNPNYNSIYGDEQYDMVCDNIVGWMDYMRVGIETDVEHNFKHYVKLALEAENILSKLNDEFEFKLEPKDYYKMANTFYLTGLNRDYSIGLRPEQMRFAFP